MKITQTGFFRNVTEPVSQRGMMVQYADFILLPQPAKKAVECLYEVRVFGRKIDRFQLSDIEGQPVTATMLLKSRIVQRPTHQYRTMYLILEDLA